MNVTSLPSVKDPQAINAPLQSQNFIARPGMSERSLVIVTAFVLLNGVPNTWFVSTTASVDSDTGNALLVAVELCLMGLALLRIAGSIELIYQTLRLEPAVSALIGLAVASSFWSANLYLTAKDSIILAVVTLYAAYLLIRFALNEIVRLFALAYVGSAFLNLALVFGLPQYGLDGGDRWIGVYSQKNALGFAAVAAIPILLTAARDHRKHRLLYYLGALGQVALLAGSQSKTMLMATICTVALMVVYRGFRARKTLRGAVIFGLVSTSALFSAFATANIALLADILDKDVTLTGRTVLWGDLWPIFLEQPILGVGYGAAFDGYFSPVHEVWIQNRWDPTHAHNALLQTGLELGVVGIALTLFIFVRALSRATQTVRDVPGSVGIWPLAYLSTAVLISISESGVLSNNTAWLLYVLAVFSTAAQEKQRRAQGRVTPRPTLESPAADQRQRLKS